MIKSDPTMMPKDAAARRDFTMNSMAYNPLTQELYDYFGGQADIQKKVLRATSIAFAEDPLRVLRGMQFAARFGMSVDPDTARMAASIRKEAAHLSKKRLEGEWMKLMLKGKKPSKGLQFLVDTGWIDLYPELKALIRLDQEPEWHPEGTVWEHTGHVLDAAAQIADRDGLQGDDRAVLMFSALTHDLGKATTTKSELKDGRERITSHGHEAESGPLARQFLERIGIKSDIIQHVVPLVERHLYHVNLKNMPRNPRGVMSFMSKLTRYLAPATVERLVQLIEADASGRPAKIDGQHQPISLARPEGADEMLNYARTLNLNTPPERLLQGRDLMELTGGHLTPGPAMGKWVNQVQEAYMNGQFADDAAPETDTPEEARNRARERAKDWFRKQYQENAGVVSPS